MAQYKLIQDIEAEDKILGPLTLRQFIFAMVAAFLLYICFILVTKHATFLLAIFLPPALFCLFFASPFGRDQPTEVWALAKLRFWFKPRKRLWNQSGVKELVTITAPKKVERVLTNGLSQTEVKSRLRALADTLDSRGWAVKNVGAGIYASPMADSDSDRLIDISSVPQEVPSNDVVPADDILDTDNNPIARQFDTMIDQSAKTRRQQLLDQLNGIRQEEAAKQQRGQSDNKQWFVGGAPVAGPGKTDASPADEAALSAGLATRANSRLSFGNLRTVRPAGSSRQDDAQQSSDDNQPPAQPDAPVQQSSQPVTAPDDPAILSLAENNDLNVATLAREARKNKGDEQLGGEVVVSLH